MEFKNIFQPIRIGDLEIKNRLIFPSLPTKMEADGFLRENLIDYHLERVRNKVGLNILEATTIDEENRIKNFLSIGDDKYLDKLKDLTLEVHKLGGKIGINLFYGGIYNREDLGAEIIHPSEYTTEKGRHIEAASLEDIKKIVDLYARAGKRAKEADFDMLEINICQSDILHTFLSAGYNKREDDYGGSLENRTRLSREVIRGIKKTTDNMPLFIKIVARDDHLENGLVEEDIIEVLKDLTSLGLDGVTIVRGNLDTDAKLYLSAPMEIEQGYNLGATGRIKKELDIPVIASGRIIDPVMVENILSDGLADLVKVGRGILCDPEFLTKVEENRLGDIKKCIGCNEGCIDTFEDILYKNITCLRNPKIGREASFKLVKTKNPKKVAVVGGGIGGIYSAIILKKRGFDVVLYDKNSQLGGQFRYAKISPNILEMQEIMDFLLEEVKNLKIETRLNTEFKEDLIAKGKFDTIVIATGSEEKKLKIKGEKLDNVFYGYEVLSKEKAVKGKIVILGTSILGLELAEILSKDNEVTLVDEKEFGKDIGEIRKIAILNKLKDRVKIIDRVDLMEIKKDRLIYKEKNKLNNLDMDYAIICMGKISNKSNNLKQYAQDIGVEFFVIGDALIPRKALDAVTEAVNISIYEIE